MLRAIFIDIDNTLLSFDGYVQGAMRDGFQKFGLKPYTDEMFPVFKRINDRLWLQIEEGSLSFEALKAIRWNLIFDELKIDFDGVTFETYFREFLNDSAVPMPGAMDLLQTLSRDYILCAASNGPLYQQTHRLEIGGMRKYFRYLFISEEIGASKPSGEFFATCFARLAADGNGIAPAETLMIGDSLTSDMAGGRNFGMHTCYYSRHSTPAPAGEAEFTVYDLREIPEKLKSLPLQESHD